MGLGIVNRSLRNNLSRKLIHCDGFFRAEVDDKADRNSGIEKIKGGVNLIVGHVDGDTGINAEITVRPFIDHAGQFAAAFDAAKGGSAPDMNRDQLERAGGNLLSLRRRR